MKIGFVGAGKLGLPLALAIESRDHTVNVHDPNPAVAKYLKERQIPYKEEGIGPLLAQTQIRALSLDKLLLNSDLVFVAVQTPHEPAYEGITPLPEQTADFNYDYLRAAMTDISEAVNRLQLTKTVIIISTTLPGTIDREIKPMLCKGVRLCYNPCFAAMGTVIPDFLQPEMVLFGVGDASAHNLASRFYADLVPGVRFHSMRIIDAEMVKVHYNTWITMKINFANNIMEACSMIGGNVDTVMAALGDCSKRIISSAYMQGGMPDGGGCHPRDNIALAHFAKRNRLHNDIYTQAMQVREQHIKWFAELIRECGYLARKVILGKSYKPETNLTAGSPALRLAAELPGIKIWDPYVDGGKPPIYTPGVFFIATKHAVFRKYHWAPGSVVIDPWGYIPHRPKVTVIRLGRR